MAKISRALISVSDKTGILAFANALRSFGVELISTGGTERYLRESGIEVRPISDLTGFPEILDGRVKTLHPHVHAAILARRDNPDHMRQLEELGIGPIDMVVVNLYPFEATVAQPDVTEEAAIEQIDIGGPTMIRAAAKNFAGVAVVTSPHQYESVIGEMRELGGELSLETCRKLAMLAFRRTASYDAAIHNYLSGNGGPDSFGVAVTFFLEKQQDLRYGENPHQRAAFYCPAGEQPSGLAAAKQLHGKELSFNNFLDLDAALNLVREFAEPTAVIVKHSNPCGVATHQELEQAYRTALATDPVSSFGGVVGLNRPVDEATAEAIAEIFTEAVIAPAFETSALEILQRKKNIRLLTCEEITRIRPEDIDLKRVAGGYLLQSQDTKTVDDVEFTVVSKRAPTAEEEAAMRFGWRVVKWVKSNAIVYAGANRTLGIGAGQMSRVDSARLGAEKAQRAGLSLQGSAMASDAFFPFRDGIDVAASVGVTAVIQPGGSVRDDEVIEAANEHDMTMVFTGIRHFRH
jgi:phosphoribosylaminoimidazolecarboxamide formyltransferase/IMP cyclohydrolase